ncbi:MAG: 30S ribosomal protein S12 methylthiotransferase RimO [Mycobacteriales bacterium]
MPRSVAFVTVGCARADVDSEELAGQLAAAGWRIRTDASRADAVVVNTCAFVEAAKKDSIDAVLEAADGSAPVLAVGCLAERYGAELAAALPEAAGVVGFDGYPQLAARLDDALAGRAIPTHQPVDRRRLLPLAPAARPKGAHSAPGGAHSAPGGAHSAPGGVVLPPRHRLASGPTAPLRLASGCDRRCAFCAIPAFRGSYLSRPPDQVLAEAERLADAGVRELYLVSENSTSYGKDLADLRALERLLPRLAAVPGIARVRLSYLQPAELRPGLIDVITGTEGVAPYFDLSVQHASAVLLRRMRRFGDGDRFLELIDSIRAREPRAGIRSNVIVGFPGERAEDFALLVSFLQLANFDAVGVFAYSDEAGTEAAGMAQKVRRDVRARRFDRASSLVEALTAARAQARIGEQVSVLVESVRGRLAHGRAAHQAPEVDGSVVVRLAASCPRPSVGDLLAAQVVAASGVDLVAEPVAAPR